MAPTIQEIRKEMVAGLDDATITEALNNVTGVMCTSAYPDYGPENTAEGRAQQFLELLNIVSDTLFFVNGEARGRANG